MSFLPKSRKVQARRLKNGKKVQGDKWLAWKVKESLKLTWPMANLLNFGGLHI